MANGLLGTEMVSVAGQFLEPYKVPDTGVQWSSITIYATNGTATAAKLTVAISPSPGAPADIEQLVKEFPVDANGGPFEYPCVLVQPGERIKMKCDVPGVALFVRGMEQT